MRWAIRLYWDLFIAIPVQLLLMGIALLSLVIGILDMIKQPSHALADLILIGVCAAFLLISRLRAFFWAFLVCFVVWLPLEVTLLISLAGKDYKPVSAAENIVLVLLCFLPPLVGAGLIDHARHRKP